MFHKVQGWVEVLGSLRVQAPGIFGILGRPELA